MDTQTQIGGDLAAGTRAIEENVEEKGRLDAERQGMTEVAAENEKRGHSSNGSTSDTDSTASSDNVKKERPDLSRLDSKIVKVRDVPEGDAAFAHLPEHERGILKKQIDIPSVAVNFPKLWRYATRNDKIILFVASLGAIGGGAVMPLMTVIFGSLSGNLSGLQTGAVSYSSFPSMLDSKVLYFVYLAIGEFVMIYAATVGFIYTGDHVASKVREEYLRAILRQNIGYFDKLGAGEITTRITADTNLVQDGISEKVALTLTGVATFIAAFVIGFIRYWKLTLICSCTVVAIVVVMGYGSRFIVKYNKKSLASYAVGGSVAEEVLSSIRNAVAFGTQDKLAKQYDLHLIEAEKWGFRLKAALGVMIGFMLMFIFLNYGLAFWMGSRFLTDGSVSLSQILTIILAIIIGAFSLGQVGPNMQAFTAGVAAASKIYATIDRQSPLDPTSDSGEILKLVDGDVELRNIKHIYPSRAEVVVMDNVNLSVPAGKTTALVGASGSGKSTIVGLVERFYDPVGGAVFLDGHDISKLNLRWLRQQIALVQQEPVLFSETITDNIRNGLIGSRFERESEEQQTERIIRAAKMANAHDFISSLPEGYETNVGERGFLLSGGQKQRIAIARAVVSDPKILLLDEATSALDTKSEGVVQAALEEAAKGRTTIVIAHRLSTIKTADNIVVMQQGRIVEQGTHDELLERRTAYYNLVNAQRIGQTREQTAEDEADREKAMLVEEELNRVTSSVSETRSVDPDDEKLALGKTNTTKSVSSRILAEKKDAKDKKYSLWSLIKFISSFNKTEWYWMLLGLAFSIIAGGGQPTQGVFFSKSIVALSAPPYLKNQIRSEVSFWSLMYLMLGLVQFIAMATQGIAFAYCSERLIHRARDRAFRTMLRQDIAFFDDEENSVGALTSFLSTETTHLAGISGATLGTLLSCSTTLFGAIIISLAIGWKLALVTMSTIPVVLGCGFCRFWVLARFQTISQKSYKKSAGYACENTNAIRTVASLTREGDVFDKYHARLVDQGHKNLMSNLKNSTLYAASQSLMFLCIALGFWYGGTLIGSGEYTLFQFFICFSEIIFSVQSAGTVFSFAGDMGKAKNAASELRKLFDRQPKVDPWSADGEKVDHVDGTIEFRDVHFRYPTRPDVPVLRGLNLTVKPGQYVALVGASGCGKSTTIAMMERFYDPLAGGVYVDGREISRLNVNEYRKHLALVSQEPTLYQGTIKENVLLGADTVEEVSDERIIQACKDANIYDFIMSLPDGFATDCGSKATLLSGGQKQRIAIARALLRDPKILLLDEATSALDSESEKVVQNALDAAAQGRTTIAVAHRLSTIQKADVIYVIEKGAVVERGTHEELMRLKGRYRELVSLQSLEKQH